jgi:hypothetical protein
MKTALRCILPFVVTVAAHAGINGTYKVSGSETASGQDYTFNGTITVNNYKSANYALKFNDGDRANFKVNFVTPVKDIKSKQTVNLTSSQGTGTATFTFEGGKYNLAFTYRSKSGSVRGKGTGTK